MAAVKDCYTLVSYYEKKFKQKYGYKKDNTNKFAARWGFDAVLQGMTLDEAKELLDYYFLTSGGARQHDLDWFFYNYEKLIEAKKKHDEDSDLQAKVRKESKERARKWRESGNKRIIGN
jgi:hypothetical protein